MSGYYWIKKVGSKFFEPALYHAGKEVWGIISSVKSLTDKDIAEVGRPILHILKGGKK